MTTGTKFVDAVGRSWSIRLTLGDLPRLKAAGLDVGAVVRDPKALAVLDDPDTFGKVFWLLCEKQATQAAVSPEQFAEFFDGPTIFAAMDAFMGAVADFSHRPAVANAMKAKLPAVNAKIDAETIRRFETETEKALAETSTPTRPTPSTPDPTGSNGGGGNSQASPESTPAT